MVETDKLLKAKSFLIKRVKRSHLNHDSAHISAILSISTFDDCFTVYQSLSESAESHLTWSIELRNHFNGSRGSRGSQHTIEVHKKGVWKSITTTATTIVKTGSNCFKSQSLLVPDAHHISPAFNRSPRNRRSCIHESVWIEPLSSTNTGIAL